MPIFGRRQPEQAPVPQGGPEVPREGEQKEEEQSKLESRRLFLVERINNIWDKRMPLAFRETLTENVRETITPEEEDGFTKNNQMSELQDLLDRPSHELHKKLESYNERGVNNLTNLEKQEFDIEKNAGALLNLEAEYEKHNVQGDLTAEDQQELDKLFNTAGGNTNKEYEAFLQAKEEAAEKKKRDEIEALKRQITRVGKINSGAQPGAEGREGQGGEAAPENLEKQ